MLSNLNWVDNIILSIFLISVLAGLMRGLVKEVISLITWLAAFVVAILFSTKLADVFTSSHQVQSAVTNASSSIGINATQSVSMVSIGISFVILFVGTLIVGSIINAIISRAVEGGGISFINRLLGGVFGLGRGFLLVLIAIFLVQLTGAQQQPWWQQSSLVSSFQPAVRWLDETVSPGLTTLKAKVTNTLQNANPSQFIENLRQE